MRAGVLRPARLGARSRRRLHLGRCARARAPRLEPADASLTRGLAHVASVAQYLEEGSRACARARCPICPRCHRPTLRPTGPTLRNCRARERVGMVAATKAHRQVALTSCARDVYSPSILAIASAIPCDRTKLDVPERADRNSGRTPAAVLPQLPSALNSFSLACAPKSPRSLHREISRSTAGDGSLASSITESEITSSSTRSVERRSAADSRRPSTTGCLNAPEARRTDMAKSSSLERAPSWTDDEMATINLRRAPFHGDWNYTIRPRKSARSRRVTVHGICA